MNIKKLSIPFLKVEQFISIVSSVGDTVEDLRIRSDFDEPTSPNMLDIVRKHCPRLTRASCMVNGWSEIENWSERYSLFFCSYGDQLIEANLTRLNNEHVGEVIEKCSNLRIKYFSASYNCAYDCKRLLAVGMRVESFYLSGTWESGEDWSRALSQCTNLRNLHVADGRMFSCSPSFVPLRALKLTNFDVELGTVLQVASKTSSLREFEVRTRGLLEDGTVFQPIVSANRDLRDILVFKPSVVGGRCA